MSTPPTDKPRIITEKTMLIALPQERVHSRAADIPDLLQKVVEQDESAKADNPW